MLISDWLKNTTFNQVNNLLPKLIKEGHWSLGPVDSITSKTPFNLGGMYCYLRGGVDTPTHGDSDGQVGSILDLCQRRAPAGIPVVFQTR